MLKKRLFIPTAQNFRMPKHEDYFCRNRSTAIKGLDLEFTPNDKIYRYISLSGGKYPPQGKKEGEKTCVIR